MTVCAALVLTFIATGFASSAYHREKTQLGIDHYSQGRACQARGDLNDAVEEYRKALIFTPNNAQYRLSLAESLLDAGRFSEARGHLERLLEDDPTSGPINILAGELAARQNRLHEAVSYFQRGVYEYWPEADLGERRKARWQLANLLKQTGDHNGFIGELMQLYANLPDTSVDEKLRVGSLLLANGATSEAFRVYQEQAKVAAQNPAARLGLGQVYFAEGEYVSARHEFQRALKLDAKNAPATQMLDLTNHVIDLDPLLPNILPSEQLRRSRNLLSEVIKNLTPCTPKQSDASKQLDDAGKLLNPRKRSEDDAFAMQSAALHLWTNRASFCGNQAPPDQAVETVLARIGNE